MMYNEDYYNQELHDEYEPPNHWTDVVIIGVLITVTLTIILI